MSRFLSLNTQNVCPLSLSGSASLYRLWLRDHPPPPGPARPLPALAGGQARLSAEMHGSVYLFNPLDLFIRFKSPLFDKSPESGGGSGSLDTEAGPHVFPVNPSYGVPVTCQPAGQGQQGSEAVEAEHWRPWVSQASLARGSPGVGTGCFLFPPRLVWANPCVHGKGSRRRTRQHRSFGNSPLIAQVRIAGLAFESLQINHFPEALPAPHSATSGP